MQKINTRLEKLTKALAALEDIYLDPNDEKRKNIDSTIQRFEFTFELFWKVLKEFFITKGIELNYPKDILKEAYSNSIIDDEALWLRMLQDRNLTSHTYDEDLADQIFARIKLYVPAIRKSFDTLLKIIEKK